MGQLTSNSPLSPKLNWRAGNIARSRLSGGSSPISTGPWKFFSRASQPGLHGILLDVRLDAFELLTRSNETIKAFLLPKCSMRTQKKIGLVRGESLERTQPFSGLHVRRYQQMNVVRHHDKRMKLIPVQSAVSVPQRRNYHLCDFRPFQKQRATRACIQEPVDSDERLARRSESGWWEHPTPGKTSAQSERYKQRLLDYVPMGKSPFVMTHTCLLCSGGRDALRNLEGGQYWPQPPFRRPSRLRAGCGQDCPPSNLCLEVAGGA